MNFALVGRYLKFLSSYYIGRPLFMPDTISIIISNICNLKCQMCDFWKDNKSSPPLSREVYNKFFNDTASCGIKRVQFTGGEPLLNNEIYNLLSDAKGRGLSTMMVTNGTLITSKNSDFIIRNLDTIYISIDAPNIEQHDMIRGIEGAFQKTTDGIRLLIKARAENAAKTRIIIASTIVSDGIHDPQDMLNLAGVLGVDSIIYNPASSVNYGDTHLKAKFTENSIFANKYAEMIDKILRIMQEPFSRIRSNPFYLECSKEFLKGNKKFMRIPCYGGGYNGLILSLKGEIFPCCAWNKSMGNIIEKPFSRIWASKEAKEIRRKIKAKECPMCHHHTRTFDYIIQSPFLIKNPVELFKGYRKLGSF